MTGMLKLDEKIAALSGVFNSMPDVLTVFLFGSYGTEYQTPLSDIDLAVLFDQDLSLQEEAALLNRLCVALDTDRVDLLNLNKAPLALKFRVVSEGRIIYEKDYIATCNFTEQVIKYYHDFAITLRKFYRDYDQSLREAYLDGE